MGDWETFNFNLGGERLCSSNLQNISSFVHLFSGEWERERESSKIYPSHSQLTRPPHPPLKQIYIAQYSSHLSLQFTVLLLGYISRTHLHFFFWLDDVKSLFFNYVILHSCTGKLSIDPANPAHPTRPKGSWAG